MMLINAQVHVWAAERPWLECGPGLEHNSPVLIMLDALLTQMD